MTPQTIVVCVRDPDASNEYRWFGPEAPIIVDIDCGYLNLDDPEEFADWAESAKADHNILKNEDARRHIREIVVEYADAKGHAAPDWTKQ